MKNFATFFVLNGLFNGEEGVRAITAGVGKQLKDGWYPLFESEDDPSIGPFESKEAAERAAHEHNSFDPLESRLLDHFKRWPYDFSMMADRYHFVLKILQYGHEHEVKSVEDMIETVIEMDDVHRAVER